MRVCNCVGYLTNPGGVCCMDLWQQPVTKWANPPYYEPNYPLPQPLERDIKLFPLLQFTDEEVIELRKLLDQQKDCQTEEKVNLNNCNIWYDDDDDKWHMSLDWSNGEFDSDLEFNFLRDVIAELSSIDRYN